MRDLRFVPNLSGGCDSDLFSVFLCDFRDTGSVYVDLQVYSVHEWQLMGGSGIEGG